MLPSKFTFDIEIIKCPICTEVFKSPRVLPCGHTVCLSCLSTLIISSTSRTKDTFLCPTCRKQVKPRDSKNPKLKWAPQFPVNASILRLLRNASAGSERSMHKAFCEICLKNNTTRPAVAYCNSCFEHHCEICKKHHQVAEETKHHQVVSFSPRNDEKVNHVPKFRIERRKSTDDGFNLSSRASKTAKGDKGTNSNPTSGDPRQHQPQMPPLVTQTITATQSEVGKTVIRLGFFNGASLTDAVTCEFVSMTFLTDSKLILSDTANKKIKVFDISHKTRVEIISEMVLRANPLHLCKVDDNTFAVLTERSGTFHVRLFTVREKLQHFVARIVDGTPIGLGYMSNVFVCTLLRDTGLHKYRLTRSQQLKIGILKQDGDGKELFHQPGAVTCGAVNGVPVVYIADEAEYGVTVMAVDARGNKLSSVFVELVEPKPKVNGSSKGPSLRGVLKSKRFNQMKLSQSLPLPKKDDTKDGAEPEADGGDKTSRRSKNARGNLMAFTSFRNVVDQVRLMKMESQTPPDDSRLSAPAEEPKTELLSVAVPVPPPKQEQKPGHNGRLLKRVLSKSAQKVGKCKAIPEQTEVVKPLSPPLGKDQQVEKKPTTPKVYRADGLAIDNEGYIYICMCKANKVHQVSPDGISRRDILSATDGLMAPKAVGFSPSNDVFLVTCAQTNKILMYKLK